MKKRTAIALICLAVLALLGGKWIRDRYVVFRWQLLSRDAQVLDLRDRELTADGYEKLQKKLKGESE